MRNRILLAVLVLFLSLIFCSSVFADLYIINDKDGKNVCITNIDAEISKYRELGYELILVPYSNLLLKEEKTTETEIKQDLRAKIRIVDWTNYVDGNYHYIQGILKNVGKSTLDYVEVKIIAFDSSKKLVILKRTYADPYRLAPGQEATFSAMIKFNSRIENFDLRVDWKEG